MTLPTVLYQDASLIAFDKPSGLLTIADRWDQELDHLLALAQAEYGPDCVNVHRIDKDTSGILLFARDRPTAQQLGAQFEQHTITKQYLALVSPVPPQSAGIIQHALAADDRKPGTMRVDRRGKPATTEYRVIEQWRDQWAWVELQPTTGRTHQLRVHLAAIGAPILGDTTYRGKSQLMLSDFKRKYRPGPHPERPLLTRLALHAARLSFVHPTTLQQLTITSPVPTEIEYALQQLRRYS